MKTKTEDSMYLVKRGFIHGLINDLQDEIAIRDIVIEKLFEEYRKYINIYYGDNSFGITRKDINQVISGDKIKFR